MIGRRGCDTFNVGPSRSSGMRRKKSLCTSSRRRAPRPCTPRPCCTSSWALTCLTQAQAQAQAAPDQGVFCIARRPCRCNRIVGVRCGAVGACVRAMQCVELLLLCDHVDMLQASPAPLDSARCHLKRPIIFRIVPSHHLSFARPAYSSPCYCLSALAFAHPAIQPNPTYAGNDHNHCCFACTTHRS